MCRTVFIIGNVDLPGLATHLAILHIGLEEPAGRIDTDRDDLAAIGTSDVGFCVPSVEFSRRRRRVWILWI